MYRELSCLCYLIYFYGLKYLNCGRENVPDSSSQKRRLSFHCFPPENREPVVRKAPDSKYKRRGSHKTRMLHLFRTFYLGKEVSLYSPDYECIDKWESLNVSKNEFYWFFMSSLSSDDIKNQQNTSNLDRDFLLAFLKSL